MWEKGIRVGWDTPIPAHGTLHRRETALQISSQDDETHAGGCSTANLRTKILDFRGFDSSSILI